MSDLEGFSYSHFLSLTGSQLVAYTEPYVNIHNEHLQLEDYKPLRDGLASMDSAHVTYAMEICMRLNPSEFVGHAVKYLSHSDAAVCCAAFRCMEFNPPSSLPPNVVTEIVTTPVVELFGPDLRTGKRVCIGTNESLLRGLIAKLVPNPVGS